MRLKVFNILLILSLSTFPLLAQYKLSGSVSSRADSTAIGECYVQLRNTKHITTTDVNGKFIFNNVSPGKYSIIFTEISFTTHSIEIEIGNEDLDLTISLIPKIQVLQEIEVTDKRNDFGFTRMNAVENFGIYEGKKTEVIIPDQLIANAATNNARQIYSRVAGLNIWENDGAGIQLSIGGRGLDPNRTSNFNVRQNGYDVSADALGYPESYYTPPVEGIGRIQIIRGAASLQYGTQFGGLINFNMKSPVRDKKLELTARQTLGSFGFYNAFTSASGTIKKLSYYTFFQYKRGDGWRDNAHFDNYTAYANVNYQFSEATKLGLDITKMNYLAQQPGGLTDEMFSENPRQTNRERNWFKVDWNLYALHFNHKFSTSSEFNIRFFGLSAHRYSIGFRPNRVASFDDGGERDLIKGNFRNWGTEVRYLKRYQLGKVKSVALVGARYYHGFNHSLQGYGSTGKDANFKFENPDQFITYDFRFPNRNVSAFAENIFFISDKLSITPGARFEYIRTRSEGYYGNVYRDLAGNVIEITRTDELRTNGRHFMLGGIGVSYKPIPLVDVYSNISQNYRSITFSDMRISNPSSVIDPNLKDEKGYSIDLGVRSEQTSRFIYDVSLFYLNYDNRIGEVQDADSLDRIIRKRGNIGQAIIQGVEAYAEADLVALLYPNHEDWAAVVFSNVACITSEYKKSQMPGVKGMRVEFVPALNLKSGVRAGYKDVKVSFQYTYLSNQYSDATNAMDGDVSAVVGTIPAYYILDLSMSYTYKKFKLEGSINNLTNNMYFTRRATGYPGPGILPSDGRGFYLTLQVKI